MITYRLARPQEYDEYLRLADETFQGVGSDIHFADALPKVYAPSLDTARFQRIAVDAGRGIVGLIAVLPGVLHTCCGDLATGYVGTVSVRADARGEGHMKRLMHDWELAERARGCDLMLLGGQRQRYGYFGFAQGGRRITFAISRRSVRHGLRDVDASAVSFIPIEPGTAAEREADSLRRSRLAFFDRDWCGFTVACRSYHHVPVAAMEHGQLIGYAVMREGRPQALCECFARDTGALDRLLKAWLTRHELINFSLQVPEWDREALLHLRTWAEGTSCAPALMVRVLNYPRVIETLLNLKAHWTTLTEGEAILTLEGQTCTVRVAGQVCTVTPGGETGADLNAKQAAAFLFEPFCMEDMPERPGNWFPLPLSCAEPDDF